MSSTTTANTPPPTDLAGALDSASAKATTVEGISLNSFLASLSVAAIVFGVQFFFFICIRHRLPRIYQPRSYLVPDKERVDFPPRGIWQWLRPVFGATDVELIEKCGMDAYFFIRFLRTLLKIFVTLALIILPILLPLNAAGGRGSHFAQGQSSENAKVTGLDQLSFGNVRPDRTDRYWAHLVLAVFVIVYVCYVIFQELRYYVRMRLQYLTTPQHRLRASATTVLITGIPPAFQSVKALDELYDVFPGGIRNIWLNRNYDELSDKVKWRNRLALRLEQAETTLIQKAFKTYMKRRDRETKEAGQRLTRKAKNEQRLEDDRRASQMAEGSGTRTGNPHQVKHTVWEATHDTTGRRLDRLRPWKPVPALEQGLGYVGHRFNQLGHSVRQGFRPGQRTTRKSPHQNDGVDERDEDQTLNEAEGHPLPEEDHSSYEKESNSVRHGFNQPAVYDLPVSYNGTMNDQDGAANVTSPDTLDETQLHSIASTPPYINNSSQPAAVHISNTRSTPRWKFWARTRSRQADSSGPPPLVDGPTDLDQATSGDNANLEAQEPIWKKYLSDSDRETMWVPPFAQSTLPSIPFIGKKVDTIDYCREMVAKLNISIEHDQKHEERFPLMNSAFVQFNSQMAAHMACQSLSHHLPKHMAPRVIEVSPEDVMWDNMSIRWWERYLRTGLTITIVAGLVIGWAIPVTFTGLLSQVKALTAIVPWLNWINRFPNWAIGLVQGVLPPVILAGLMALLPIILRFLSKQRGLHTGNAIELSVQDYYFVFLFVQVFLIVSISTGITTALKQLIRSIGSAPAILAINLPRASNYFFSYMLLQAFSVSAGALLQIGGLFSWFVLAPFTDNTARARWTRQVNLPTVQWGSFFPIYTNLAAIGLIYSIISPLILVFNVITFSMFWVAYRYNTLYVNRFKADTGGLVYPKAINQLFTGLYVMELCMIGLFFLVRDTKDRVACRGQAIAMIMFTIFTAIYQFLLNEAFRPLYKYMPVTLEDDACLRDKEFAQEIEKRRLMKSENEKGDEGASDLAGVNREVPQVEMDETTLSSINKEVKGSKQDHGQRHHRPPVVDLLAAPAATIHTVTAKIDAENQRQLDGGQALFMGLHDQLEDLDPEDRDFLVKQAYKHEALRAKRPVIWIPRDHLGISDDEVRRTRHFNRNIWISNEYTGLDSKAKVVYRRGPPDFSELDLIRL